MSGVLLEGVRIENLRGFYDTSISLRNPRTLIVGPNNSGKTSLLRLLDWVLNELDPDNLKAGVAPSSRDLSTILPARQTRHRARRITLHLRIEDGRSWTRFGCDSDGRVDLRVNARLTPRPVVFLALGSPTRDEAAISKSRAVELLRRLQASVHFVHIPSFRDAASDRFGTTLSGAIRRRIDVRAIHESQGGAPGEYRALTNAFGKIRRVLLGLAQPLWKDVQRGLPPGFARDAEVLLDCDWPDVLDFLEANLCLRVTTGDHDSSKVSMTELGSGLQSLFDLAIQEAEIPSGRHTIIAAEEPEAFLHPAAQRVTASRLLSAAGINQAIVTTHSSVFIDEACYGDVVIAREHRFYEPVQRAEADRAEINTALLTGHGAEALFASSLLLVEGEGDRQFFEALRRRIAQHDDSGLADTCFVIASGGNKAFAPWIRLLESYGSPSDRPIRWIVSPDGDSSPETRRAFADAGYPVPQTILDGLGAVSAAKTSGDIRSWREAAVALNALAQRERFPLHFLLLDLEESALGAATQGTVACVCERLKYGGETDHATLLSRLGSKGYDPVAEPLKAPWIRGFIGHALPPKELPQPTRLLLLRWLAGSMGDKGAERLLKRWEA